jgi:hypothetical protein
MIGSDELSSKLEAAAGTFEPRRAPSDVLDHVMSRSGQLRRRRRGARAAAVIGSAAVVAVAAVGVSTLDLGNTSSPQPAGQTDTGWAVASGTTVQLGNGKTLDLHRPVGFLYQTSAGVLVMFGSTNAPWGGGRKYALLSEDGATRTDFTIPVDNMQPGTDPTQPYVVYTQATDSPTTWDLVVRDLRVDKVVDTIPVKGSYTWTDETPTGVPAAFLSGSHVYISFDDTAVSVDLKTRKVTPNDVLPASEVMYIEGGKASSFHNMTISDDGTIERTWQIVDITTGDVVLKSAGLDERVVHAVSPDGSHAIVSATCIIGSAVCDEIPSTAFIYNLDTGNHVELDSQDALLTWTATGSVLRVTPAAGTVDVCDPDSATCKSTKLEVDDSDVQVPGVMNW